MAFDRERDDEPEPALHAPVLRGGSVLLLRQAAGALIGFAAMLALARLIGPAETGLYFTAFGIVFFVQNIARLGLDVFLVRAPGPLDKPMLDRVFLLLAGLGLAAAALTAAAGPPLAHALGIPGLAGVMLAMAASIPVTHLCRVPLARLERELAYGRIGAAELAAQLAFLGVAVGAALAGLGGYAPVAGWWAQQLALLAACLALSGYRPALPPDLRGMREALGHGSIVTGSILIQSLRPLVVPIVIGGSEGAAAVGIVSLAVRLVENLGMGRTVIGRIAVPLFARLAPDRPRLLRALRTGMEAQTLAVALPVAGFALAAPWLVPRLFGPDWSEAARLLPLLAPPAIVAAVFGLHTQLLMTERRPHPLVTSQAAATALAWAAAAVLVPRLGPAGYAGAEIVAAAAWIVPARFVRRRFGPVGYDPAAVWAAAAILAALAPLLGCWPALALPALAFHAPTRREIRRLARLARAGVAARRTPPGVVEARRSPSGPA